MKISINNIIVVRFSLRVEAWKRRLFFNDSIRESWFAYRAELYRQTLGASIAAQTVQPTRIYLLMDPGDRDLQERHLPAIGFTPIFTVANESRVAIASELKREGLVDNVAMTRIDSDDIVELSYFDKINSQLQMLMESGRDSELIVTCKGYRSNFLKIQSLYHSKAPFITLFRTQYGGETVYSFDHTKIDQQKHIKNISAEWMQVIHGTNVANGFKPATAESLQPYLAGMRGPAALQLEPIDLDWFRGWAGFELPNPILFDKAPMHSVKSHIRRFWRGFRGKI